MVNKVSFVLGTYNRLSFLKVTIDSIRHEIASSKINAEIIVVDGGSDDGTLKWLEKQKDIIAVIQFNRGKWNNRDIPRRSWGYFMNLGFKIAEGNYICMLSDDCWLVPGSLKNAVNVITDENKKNIKIGGVAFYWRNWPFQKEYNVGITLGHKLFVNHGIFLKEAVEKVGYINDIDYSFYHADGDLSLKIWEAGYKIVDSEGSLVEHYAHANVKVRNSNNSRQKADWTTYRNKWGIVGDDYEGDWKMLEGNHPETDVPWEYIIHYFIDLIRSKFFI